MSNSIRNTFMNVLPIKENNFFTCYFHVCQNLQKIIPDYNTKVKAYVMQLYLSQTKPKLPNYCLIDVRTSGVIGILKLVNM